jgi:hypothetical protein
LYKGNVSAKNPSPAGVVRMASIAARLNARVQGDDGEFYDDRGAPTQSHCLVQWSGNTRNGLLGRFQPISQLPKASQELPGLLVLIVLV